MKEILELIEQVDPEDSEKLDEIDWKVREYLDPAQHKYERAFLCDPKRYTRSRNALKAIRPERVSVTVTAYTPLNHAGCTANLWSIPEAGPFSEHWTFKSPDLPTEELAELRAILQAIEYERTI